MLLSIKTHLAYTTAQACDMLLQIEANSDATQHCHDAKFSLTAGVSLKQASGEEGIGTRRWATTQSLLDCRYEAQIEISRDDVDLIQLTETPRYLLPEAAIKYLMPSRYCHPEVFEDFTKTQFADQSGGALVNAMRHWVATNFTYDNSASHSGTTATDSFASLKGVCRDYAHVLIALTRAAGIPARFVSAYAPDVSPPDFHAVAEVYLDGDWHLVDPTGMAKPSNIARICVGRDAADTSFLTSFGWMDFQQQSVVVQRCPEKPQPRPTR